MKCDYCEYSRPSINGYSCSKINEPNNEINKFCEIAISRMEGRNNKNVNNNTDINSKNDAKIERQHIKEFQPDSLINYLRFPRTREEICSFLNLDSISYTVNRYINPLVDKGIIKRTIPNHPRSRNQMYYISEDYKKENENEQGNN